MRHYKNINYRAYKAKRGRARSFGFIIFAGLLVLVIGAVVMLSLSKNGDNDPKSHSSSSATENSSTGSPADDSSSAGLSGSTSTGSASTSSTGPTSSTGSSAVSRSSASAAAGRVIDPNDYLILVNADNPLPLDYVPSDLVRISTTRNIELRKKAAEAYFELLEAAKAEGYTSFYLNSGFRTSEYQATLFNNQVNQLKSQYGNNAAVEASKWVARPGTSEHQTGLAVDISLGPLEQSFGETSYGKWLAANCERFGFVLRYQKEKTGITKVYYEPWHIRYVGKEHAKKMNEMKLCLEEYLELLKK